MILMHQSHNADSCRPNPAGDVDGGILGELTMTTLPPPSLSLSQQQLGAWEQRLEVE